jgi:hypothetical protein
MSAELRLSHVNSRLPGMPGYSEGCLNTLKVRNVAGRYLHYKYKKCNKYIHRCRRVLLYTNFEVLLMALTALLLVKTFVRRAKFINTSLRVLGV